MKICRYCFCIICASLVVYAKDYCSLLVKIVDPRGREADVRVSVEEQDGRIIEKDNRHGGVRFCDLGISPVSVKVGHPSCNQVVVRNVPLEWGKTRILKITYDVEPCLIDTPPVAACAFLFRLVDQAHKPITASAMDLKSPNETTLRSDEFGRIFIRIGAGQELTARAIASGYRPEGVRITCSTKNQRLERYVTLVDERGRGGQ